MAISRSSGYNNLPNDNFWIKAILNSSPDPSWEKYLLTA